MNKLKKYKRKIRYVIHKYVNGTKGIISLFLVLVMLPLSSTALLLVESARYQNAMQLVDELIDCVGLSSIADFDSYLDERFGLLSMSQETDPSTNYNKYLTANIPALKNSFSYTSSTVVGVYPLSENNVLKAQLLEHSEVSTMTELLYNGLNIEDLLEELNNILDTEAIKEINNLAVITNKAAELTLELKSLCELVESTVILLGECRIKFENYQNAITSFHLEAGELIDTLKTAKLEVEEEARQKKLELEQEQQDEIDAAREAAEDAGEEYVEPILPPISVTQKDIYEVQSVKDAVAECEAARNTLQLSLGDMSESLSAFSVNITAMLDSKEKIVTTVGALNETFSEEEDEEETNPTEETSDWVIKSATKIIDKIPESFNASVMTALIDELNNQNTLVGNVICNKSSGEDSSKYYINIDSSIDTINNDFSVISIPLDQFRFVDDMKNITFEIMEEAILTEEEINQLNTLLDIAEKLSSITTFYDGELDSTVNSAYEEGVSLSDGLGADSLTRTINAGRALMEGIFNANFFQILGSLGTFLVAVAEFIFGIVTWVGTVSLKLIDFVANIVRSPAEVYNSFLLAGYGIYNMPSRVTYDSGASLDGYEYSSINEMMSESANEGIGFKGAEVEYLLVGSNVEIKNQSAAFFNLYMLRMVLDLVPILTNRDVTALASGTTIGAWVVYLAYIIAEPMIDVLLLVNDQSIFLIKNFVFLTPEGIVTIANSLVGSVESEDESFKALQEELKKLDTSSGTIEMGYAEYMMLLIFLKVNQENLLNRYSNIIEMEATAFYKDSYEFDLDKANTYIKTTVTGTLNSMFDMEALTKDGPFTINRTRYIGY